MIRVFSSNCKCTIRKKQLILFACLSLIVFFAAAQPVLIGMAKRGGTAQTGTVISYNVSSANVSVLNNFNPLTSSGTCKLIYGSDEKLYGTHYNGLNGYGGIYSLDPTTDTYTTLFNFNGQNGASPFGLIEVNGNIYGTTISGGSPSGYGVLYFFNPHTNEYRKLLEFDGAKGSYPKGLTLAGNGKIYGLTSNGGTNNAGTIFLFDPATNVFEKLKDFDGTIGSHPTGSLCLAANGLLYGMTETGGKWNRGIIYSFHPITKVFTKLLDFDGMNGSSPTAYASLIQASNGKLYGMTYSGGSSNLGIVFSFDPVTSNCKSVKDFDAVNGSLPYSDLTQTGDGKLYGVTSNGGVFNKGVIFFIDAATESFTKEQDLDGLSGGNPVGNLVMASSGKLYGATSKNSVGFGNLFSFEPSSKSYSVLQTFGLNTGGSFASASLLKTIDGKIYGTTINGGANGFGIIFLLNPNNNSFTKLYDFDGASGGNPYGSLVEMNNKLYGQTSSGGSNQLGVIFSFDPSTNGFQLLKTFTGTDGANPFGSLLAHNNKLYGMTRSGGTNDKGVIFSFDPDPSSSSPYTKLWDFDGVSGANPFGNLAVANNGKLYGMTYAGGSSNLGIIFSFNPVTKQFTRIKDFDGYSGARPYGSLVLARNGKLYGMTLTGGKTTGKGSFGSSYSNDGIIFSLDPVNNSFTKLKDFDNTNGANPNGNLFQASNDKFYGMTAGGGSKNLGVMFCYDPSNKTPYSKLKDFDGTNGANPSYGSSFIELGLMTAFTTVRSAGDVPAVSVGKEDMLKISVLPNPSSNQFTLKLNSHSEMLLQLRVFDAAGRLIERKSNVTVNSVISLGQAYRPGVYIVELMQGNIKSTLKLLKTE